MYKRQEKERRKYLLDNLFHIYDAFVRQFMSLLIFKEEIQGIPFKKKDINSKMCIRDRCKSAFRSLEIIVSYYFPLRVYGTEPTDIILCKCILIKQLRAKDVSSWRTNRNLMQTVSGRPPSDGWTGGC